MPIVFRYRGFKFFFYSNEGTPRELLEIVEANTGRIERAWDEFFR